MEQGQQVRARAWSIRLSRHGLAFLVGIAVPGLCCFWGASHPGLSVGWFLSCLLLVALAGGAWLILTVVSLRRRQVEIGVLVAPLLAGLLAIVITAHLPAKARFAASAGDFQALVAVAGPPPASHWGPFPGECPKQVGLYGIRDCATFPAGYLFYDTTGAMFSDAGIGYLPQGIPTVGISNGSFESPVFTHLQGPWYTFVAGW